MLELQQFEKRLCESLCARVAFIKREDGVTLLETPFVYPDGDHYPIYVSETGTGGIRIGDGGHTLMHLSYDHDVNAMFEGTRGRLRERILGETGIQEKDGAFYIDATVENLPEAVFRLGQALTRIYDLSLLSRQRAASVFYDDLWESLTRIVGEEKIQKDYLPEVEGGDNYPIDFRIEGKHGTPVFVHGVPGRDKARLTTIILAFLLRQGVPFESLLVFENQQEIARRDLARLSDVGGQMISSLDAQDDLRRKVLVLAA